MRAESDGCEQAQVGSGWVVARGRVATNAHVVAGADRVTVSVRGTGREHSARVVAFDPRRDVAVLDVTDLGAPAVGQGAALVTGSQAALAGFPGDHGLWVGAARVRDVLRAKGADIYGNPDVSRQIYSLRAEVRRGASGGPVIDRRGEVVGMVFATSLDDPDTGYALTLDEIAPVLRRGRARLARRVDGAVPLRLTGSVTPGGGGSSRMPGPRRAGGRGTPAAAVPGAWRHPPPRRRHPRRRTVP